MRDDITRSDPDLEHLWVEIDWSGNFILTGDMNIDLLSNSPSKDLYQELLNSLDLIQHVNSPTRKGKSLIDHVITNSNYKIKTCDVLPTPEIAITTPYLYALTTTSQDLNRATR